MFHFPFAPIFTKEVEWKVEQMYILSNDMDLNSGNPKEVTSVTKFIIKKFETVLKKNLASLSRK